MSSAFHFQQTCISSDCKWTACS